MGDRFKVYVDAELARIMPRYFELRQQEQAQLMAAIGAQDMENITLLGHRLKGSGTSYGFPDLTALGDELEQAGKAHDLARASRLAEEIQEYLSGVEVVYTEDGE